MRILQVITTLLTGGAEHIVVQLAEQLTERGMHCDICVFDGQQTPFAEEIEAYNKHLRDRGLDPIVIHKLGNGVYNPMLIPRLARLMRHYDIVHTHNSSPQLYAAIAKVLCSVVLVTTEHNTSNRKRGWKWYAPIESWMYSQYDHTICISKVAEDKLREYMGGKWLDTSSAWYGRISTINNGVDVNAFHTAAPAADLMALKEGRKAIVMVAGFRDAKDQDTLVRAMTHLEGDSYELWLVGIGDRQDTVRQLAHDKGVEDRVRFVGLRMDVPQVLRAADIVVMSSHWEGLSLSNVEGMSAGKPFLASNVNGLREVTQGYGLLFSEGDDEHLAGYIKRLCTDKALYERLAMRCYHRALDFDISNMVGGYADIYNSFGK